MVSTLVLNYYEKTKLVFYFFILKTFRLQANVLLYIYAQKIKLKEAFKGKCCRQCREV